MGCLAMDAPPGQGYLLLVQSLLKAGLPPLIRSKIKQIEYRQCNDGIGEPKTENVARIVPCDALSGAGSRHFNRSLGVGIRDVPVAPFELSFGLADQSYLSSGRKFGIVIQEGGVDKSWSAPRTRSSSLRSLPCRDRWRAAPAARLKPDRTPERCLSGLRRAPLPDACARACRDRYRLDEL